MATERAAGVDDATSMTSFAVAEAGVAAAPVRYDDVVQLLAIVIVLGVIILATVVGNAFVIAAVVLERNLRTHVANYLIASLAVADLLVALLVMPLAAVNEVCSSLPLPHSPPLSLSLSLSLSHDAVLSLTTSSVFSDLAPALLRDFFFRPIARPITQPLRGSFWL